MKSVLLAVTLRTRFLMGAALTALVAVPTALIAQDATQPVLDTKEARDASLTRPLSEMPLTGTPNGIPEGAITPAIMASVRVTATPQLVEGQPVETRPPEKKDDRALFAGQTRVPYKKSVDFQTTTLAQGLSHPWSLAFLPSGNILITEKTGSMRVLRKDGSLSQPVANVPKVNYIGQVGLLDVALDNNFKSNKRIFFTFSDPVGETDSQHVLARATFDEAANSLSDVTVIYRVTPALNAKRQASNAGGRIAIARDNTIFMTVGDRSRPTPWLLAQRLDTALGKVIRVTADGAAAPGNPFAGRPGALPEIYSVGHRSEQGLAFDPQGRLWEHEHGARGGDELNLIEPGKNYGWPVITHGIDYPGYLVGDGIIEGPGMEQPRYFWSPSLAPSGLAFYQGNLFPAWRNSAFAGTLRGQMIVRLEMKGTNVVAEEPLLWDQKQRYRDVRIGPDGAVYVLTDGADAKLLKLTPQ